MLNTLIKCLQCLMKGNHEYLYIGRNYNGPTDDGKQKLYSLMYVCSHCQHFSSKSEVE